jgi:hypothetical protein
MRVHHQVNTWIQLKTTLKKEHYVFRVQGGRVFPIFTDMEAAPPSCCSSWSAHAKALKTDALKEKTTLQCSLQMWRHVWKRPADASECGHYDYILV